MNTQSNTNLFIISGEASGDMHGAKVVAELKATDPNLNILCWGGDLMQSAGAKVLKHYRELAFMGFWEVIRNIWTIQKNFQLVKKQILEANPSVVILIDYPGFNLRLLPWLKKNGFHVIYYIAPQAWAWKEGRVQQMRKYIDELLVILPFEEKFFKDRGMEAEFIGHPLMQQEGIQVEIRQSQITNQIALLPGSRVQEVKHILPEMISVMDSFPDYKFVIAGMSHISAEIYKSIIAERDVQIVYDASSEVIRNSDIVLVSSGTATLQTALMNIPQIVCYKTGWLNYELGKRLIKVKYISLVNLIFDREVVPELIHSELNTENIVSEMNLILNQGKGSQIQEEYAQLRTILGEKNASKRVAEVVMKYWED